MTDTESLACGDVGLLPEVQAANDLLKACIPLINQARKACMTLHAKTLAASANDPEANAATAIEAEDASARYRGLIVLIEELATRYA